MEVNSVETGTFKIKANVTEEQLRQAYDNLREALKLHPGFLDNQLLKGGDEEYMDLVFSKSKKDSLEVCDLYLTQEVGKDFLELILPESANMTFWQKI